jgi:hypothetical protein
MFSHETVSPGAILITIGSKAVTLALITWFSAITAEDKSVDAANTAPISDLPYFIYIASLSLSYLSELDTE